MAVFTELTDQQITALCAPYGLAVEYIEPIAAGTQNTLYRVVSRNNAYVFTLFEGALANQTYVEWFINLHTQLAAEGFPCPAPLKDLNGDTLRLWNNTRPYCLFPFISGQSPTPTVKQARAIGAVLAQLHKIEPIVPYMENSWGIATMKSVAAHLNGNPWPEALSAVKTLIGSADISHLPAGLIHADLFPDNTLFEGDTLKGVIDFFFACHDAYAYDLAITVTSWAFNAQNKHMPAIEAAIIEGYTTLRPLTASEQAAMPMLLQLACARFFLSRLQVWENPQPQKTGAPHNPAVYAARLNHYQEQAQ